VTDLSEQKASQQLLTENNDRLLVANAALEISNGALNAANTNAANIRIHGYILFCAAQGTSNPRNKHSSTTGVHRHTLNAKSTPWNPSSGGFNAVSGCSTSGMPSERNTCSTAKCTVNVSGINSAHAKPMKACA